MDPLFAIARALGTDPISLVILGVMAFVGARFMNRAVADDRLTFVYFPALLGGGLLTDDAAIAMGLYTEFQVQPVRGGGWSTSWTTVNETLPLVMMSGTIGMAIMGLLILLTIRILDSKV